MACQERRVIPEQALKVLHSELQPPWEQTLLSLMLCDSKKSGPLWAKAKGRLPWEMEGFPTKPDSSKTQNC